MASVDMDRVRLEKVSGLKVPFDDDVLMYLLRVVPVSDKTEVYSLVEDFCPRFSSGEKAMFAEKLIEVGRNNRGQESPQRTMPKAAPKLVQDEERDVARGLEADRMLAQLLQEEQDTEMTLNGHGSAQARTSKKSKKAFRPFNIDYNVGRGATPAQLSTAAPSSLAETLRSRRTQGQNALLMQPEHFGPPAARADTRSLWAPSSLDLQGGLTWAERAQAAAASQPVPEVVAPVAPARPPVTTGWTLKLQTNTGSEYKVKVEPGEAVGDVKARVEKLHGIPGYNQRLLLMGRELADSQDLRQAGVRDGQSLQLALRDGAAARPPPGPPAAPPPPRSSPHMGSRTSVDEEGDLTLKLRMPNNMEALLCGLPAVVTASAVKRRIQEEHGIRADHLALSFFGQPLDGNVRLRDCGVATGARVDVELRPPQLAIQSAGCHLSHLVEQPVCTQQTVVVQGAPPSSPPHALKPVARLGQQTDQFAALQMNQHNRVLSEAEALELALAASRGEISLDCQVAVQEEQVHGGEDLEEKGGKKKRKKKKQQQQLQPQEQHQQKQALQQTQPLPLPQQKKPQQPQPLPQQQQGTTSAQQRSEFIRKIFAICDTDADGVLSEEEMKPFAVHTGFDGTDEEWQAEYGALCIERGADGARMDLASFEALINDTSDSGCHCTDEELKSMLQALPEAVQRPAHTSSQPQTTQRLPPPAMPSVPPTPTLTVNDTSPGRHHFEAKVAAQNLASDYASPRVSLIREIFTACDADGDGHLNEHEMKIFACLAGFDSTNDAWTAEYALLCAEKDITPNAGINVELFRELVDDESDAGQYCTDNELRDMLRELNLRRQQQASRPPPPGAAPPATMVAGPPPGIVATPSIPAVLVPAPVTSQTVPVMPAEPRGPSAAGLPPGLPPPGLPAPLERAELARAVFRAYDEDKDGYLNMREMHKFAQYTGFEGNEQEWRTEFSMLCTEWQLSMDQGVNVELFMQLIDDDSDSGCYCTDDELRTMLRQLFSNVKARAKAEVAEFASMPEAAVHLQSPSRNERISQLFCALDADKDGLLNSQEMRRFASSMGFVGTDAEWAREFIELTSEDGRGGISFELFARLVNDQSEQGCHCTDEELGQLLHALSQV